jgi:hypothetical protein
VKAVIAFFKAQAKSIRLYVQGKLIPRRLRINAEQAEYVEELFLGGVEIVALAKAFFTRWPRTGFRFFYAVEENETTKELEYVCRDAESAFDGIALVEAAMIRNKAIRRKVDGWYYQTKHPMTKRLAEIGSVFTPPERGRGILG